MHGLDVLDACLHASQLNPADGFILANKIFGPNTSYKMNEDKAMKNKIGKLLAKTC